MHIKDGTLDALNPKPSTLNPKPLTTCMRETCWVPTSPSMYIHRYF